MWTIKKPIATATLLVLTAIFFTACQFSGVKGSGNVITQNRMVSGVFKSIKVENGLDAVLEQSNQTSISVIADDNLQPHIKTRIENGVLIITSDVNSYINIESKKIVVKAPNIESIEACTGSSFDTKNTIKSNTMALKSNTGASLHMALECEKATIETESAGSVKVNGKAITLEAAAASAGNIDAEKLLSNDIIASASSAGIIKIYPLVSLSADASSGGSINYYNVPKNLNKKSDTGGSISKE